MSLFNEPPAYEVLTPVRSPEVAEVAPSDEDEEVYTPNFLDGDEPRPGCYRRVRGQVKAVIDDPHESCVGEALQAGIVGMIVFSTCCVVAETVPELQGFKEWFDWTELLTTVLFTAELIARAWTADNLLQHMATLHSAVDVAAVLPWYVERFLAMALPVGQEVNPNVADSFKTLRIVRLIQFIRLLRILRLAKAAKHSDMISTVLESIRSSAAGFGTLVAFIIMGTVFSATIVYFLECEEPGTAFTSIPAAIWWAVPTITSVGYGDMVPETIAGKIAGSITMVGGILITSLSVAIMTKSFVESFERTMQLKKVQQKKRGTASQRSTGFKGRRGSFDDHPLGLTGLESERLGFRELSENLHDFVGSDDHPLVSLNKIEQALGVVLASLDLETSSNIAGNGCETHGSLLQQNWEMLKGQNKMWFRHVRRLAEQAATMEDEAEKKLAVGSAALHETGRPGFKYKFRKSISSSMSLLFPD